MKSKTGLVTHLSNDGAVLSDAVRVEATDAIQRLASLQILLRTRDHILCSYTQDMRGADNGE